MSSLKDRIERLEIDARSIMHDAEFRASMATRRGEMTELHLNLSRAKASIGRAKDAIDQVANEAERLREGAAA